MRVFTGPQGMQAVGVCVPVRVCVCWHVWSCVCVCDSVCVCVCIFMPAFCVVYEDLSTQSDNYHDQQLVTDEHIPCERQKNCASEVR